MGGFARGRHVLLVLLISTILPLGRRNVMQRGTAFLHGIPTEPRI